MAIRAAKESEIQRLVRFYRKTVKSLAQDFVGGINIARPQTFALMSEAFSRLEEVDVHAARWARRNISGLYDAVKKQTYKTLRRHKLRVRDVKRARQFVDINETAVRVLVGAPDTGFLSALEGATGQVRQRLRLVREQAKALRQQQTVINETIAQIGILEGRNLETVKEDLVRELTTAKRGVDLVWRPKLARLGRNHIFANLAEVPFVKFPSGRPMRLDHYAELVARTKTRQAVTIAQRNALLENNQALVMISNNRSLVDDACNLFIGRVFALTQEAADMWSIPRVEEIPSGGTPFHPQCTHNEIPFFPEITHWKVQDRALSSPPKWSLNRPWVDVQKDFVKRGGDSFAEEQNPNFKHATAPGKKKRVRVQRLEAARSNP